MDKHFMELLSFINHKDTYMTAYNCTSFDSIPR